MYMYLNLPVPYSVHMYTCTLYLELGSSLTISLSSSSLYISVYQRNETRSCIYSKGTEKSHASKLHCTSSVHTKCTYMYIHVYMYVHAHVYVHTHMYMHICTADAWEFNSTTTGYISHVRQWRLRSSTVKSYNCK